jgi:hypothetical protein
MDDVELGDADVDVSAVVVDPAAWLVDVAPPVSGLHADRTASRKAGAAFDMREVPVRPGMREG